MPHLLLLKFVSVNITGLPLLNFPKYNQSFQKCTDYYASIVDTRQIVTKVSADNFKNINKIHMQSDMWQSHCMYIDLRHWITAHIHISRTCTETPPLTLHIRVCMVIAHTPKDSNIRNTCHINGPCDIQPYTNAITNDFKTLTIRLKKKSRTTYWMAYNCSRTSSSCQSIWLCCVLWTARRTNAIVNFSLFILNRSRSVAV